jgi:hypothetical protein
MIPRHKCKDGTTLSIQVGKYLYCTPRNDEGPYTHVEVGYIRDSNGIDVEPPASWNKYRDGEGSSVFGYVPLQLVQAFLDSHGGALYSFITGR